jgi:5-methylcytosine-specific restriction endonuclease McrA
MAGYAWYCGLPVRPLAGAECCARRRLHTRVTDYGVRVHVDHIIPLACNGTDDIDNLAIACEFCNHAKWDMSAETYIRWLDHIRFGLAWSPFRDGRRR